MDFKKQYMKQKLKSNAKIWRDQKEPLKKELKNYYFWYLVKPFFQHLRWVYYKNS